MDRFSRLRDYLSNVNSNVLLVIGLLVIGGLVAAAFMFADTDDIADQINGVDPETEVTINDTDENGLEPAEQREDNGNGDAQADTTEQPMPSQIADAGPVAPAAAAVLLGASGYLYHRSRKQVESAHRK